MDRLFRPRASLWCNKPTYESPGTTQSEADRFRVRLRVRPTDPRPQVNHRLTTDAISCLCIKDAFVFCDCRSYLSKCPLITSIQRSLRRGLLYVMQSWYCAQVLLFQVSHRTHSIYKYTCHITSWTTSRQRHVNLTVGIYMMSTIGLPVSRHCLLIARNNYE